MAFDTVIDKAKLESALTASANAIREKTGGTEPIAWLPDKGFAEAIGAIETGGGGSADEEWFNDGNTHVWITLNEGRTSPMLSVCPNGTVTVDWGDGTTPDVLTGTDTYTNKWTPIHNYEKAGNYVITLTVNGKMSFFGENSGSGILRYSSASDSRNRLYQSAVKKLEIGKGVESIAIYAFCNCGSLASVVIPDGVTSIGSCAFQGCDSLASVVIPDGVTYIGDSVFQGCDSLASVIIPNSVTSIPSSTFDTCFSLASVIIPNSVTSIKIMAFRNCSGVKYYDFTACTAVPSLSNTNAFTGGIAKDCEIRVPAALYDEWIAATNWTTYASYIKAV